MRTPVFQNVDAVVTITNHDDRRFTNKAGLEVSGIGNFSFKPDKLPDGPVEDLVLLPGINRRVGINLIWNARQAFCGPDERRCRVRHGRSFSVSMDN